MATHSSTLAWKIPWTEEPDRLQSMGSLGVGHDWSDLAAAAAQVGNRARTFRQMPWRVCGLGSLWNVGNILIGLF